MVNHIFYIPALSQAGGRLRGLRGNNYLTLSYPALYLWGSGDTDICADFLKFLHRKAKKTGIAATTPA
jgi:hypothetical protein